MIKDQEIAQIFDQLNDMEHITFDFEGSDVIAKALDHASKISLTTPVYSGVSYIPKSVRHSVASTRSPFARGHIPTYLSIDEQNFSILLNYLGNLEELNIAAFKNLLQEFSVIAEEWRQHLDDLDNNDRVYIYQKR